MNGPSEANNVQDVEKYNSSLFVRVILAKKILGGFSQSLKWTIDYVDDFRQRRERILQLRLRVFMGFGDDRALPLSEIQMSSSPRSPDSKALRFFSH